MASRSLCMIQKSAECPICYRLLTRPKLLSCNHTFCEECLRNLYSSQRQENIISCPLCRDITPIRDGDMSRLGTNIALQSLIEELGQIVNFCSLCKSKEDALAVAYCADCDVYMCDSCRTTHASWGAFSDHEEFSVNDVVAGKVTKSNVRCSKHKSEMEDYFCLTCRKYVCFRCRVLSHPGHGFLEKEEHEHNIKERIAFLLDRVEEKNTELSQFADVVKQDQHKVKHLMEKLVLDIYTVRDEAIKTVNKDSESLVEMCRSHNEAILEKLTGSKHQLDVQRDCIESASELVKSGTTHRLEGTALESHDATCQHLQKMLDGFVIDYSRMREIRKCADDHALFTCTAVKHVPDLGKLSQRMDWVLCSETNLRIPNSMNGMAARPDGLMAVGCLTGGIDMFSAEGQYQETVLKDVKIRRLDFLSDGTFVVRDLNERISLFTPEYQKLDVVFETLSHSEGGVGGLTVDGHDQIYASYKDAHKIQMFSRTGGMPIREIRCNAMITQIFAMKSSSNLLLHLHGCNEIWILDKWGKIRHTVPAKGNLIYPYPALCRNDYVMISWIKQQKRLVSIDLYTNELKYVKSIVSNAHILCSNRGWYYLQEFVSGDIAFCTTDKLYVFNKPVTISEL